MTRQNHPSTEVFNDATLVSSQFAHYQLRRCLGEGGFGQVFEAWDSKLCRSVAIKRLKNPGMIERPAQLLKEARLAASLQHLAFVKIYSLEDDDDSQSIVMELINGQTLRQFLASQAPSAERALDIVRQVAQAMHEAHASGLIHGDLKPSNLMVEVSGTVRILDFGLAAQGDPQATTSLMQLDPQGTVVYMAPERLRGAPLSAQTDIYALGVILYELLAGNRPFVGLSGMVLAAALVQTSSDKWPYPADIPSALLSLVWAVTATEPERRVQTMQQVLERIAALAVERVAASGQQTVQDMVPAVAERRGGLADMTARLGRRTRWAMGGLALCGFLAIGGWQLAPHFAEWADAVKPFSAALEMQKGLEALKQFDRPASLQMAEATFAAILSRDSKNAAAAAGISLVYSSRYLSDERDDVWIRKADISAKQALKLNDQIALCHTAMALVFALQGKGEQALGAIEHALALDRSDVIAWYVKVSVLKKARRTEDQKAALEYALQHFPKERIFADQLGEMLINQRNYQAAEQAFRLSIRLQPDSVYAYANLYAALHFLNREEEGMQILQQGLRIRPSALLYGNLGNALFIRGDHLAATAAFEHAVSPDGGDPQDYLGWANLADTLRWIPGRANEARGAYGRARNLLAPQLAREPDNVKLVSRMGLYGARVGEKVEAIEFMRRAVALSPNDPSVHFRNGLAQELLGFRKEALAEIAKARSLGYPLKLIEAEPDLVALRRDLAYSIR